MGLRMAWHVHGKFQSVAGLLKPQSRGAWESLLSTQAWSCYLPQLSGTNGLALQRWRPISAKPQHGYNFTLTDAQPIW